MLHIHHSERSAYDPQIDYERTAFPAIRAALAEEYIELSDIELERALYMECGVESIDQMEDFMRSLSRFGSQAGNVLSRAAPGMLSGAVTGASTGAALGPYGALLGGIAGAVGGGVQSYTASQQRRPATPPTRVAQPPTPSPAPSTIQRPTGAATQPAPAPSRPAPAPSRPAPAPSRPAPAPSRPAATTPAGQQAGMQVVTQLLALLGRPEVQQALSSLALGRAGAREVVVGGRAVPVAAVTNLIGVLANRASAEANRMDIANEGTPIPEYCLDDVGEFIGDPMVPEERANVLLHLFAVQEQADLDQEYEEDRRNHLLFVEEEDDEWEDDEEFASYEGLDEEDDDVEYEEDYVEGDEHGY